MSKLDDIRGLSPSQRARVNPYFDGPVDGEDRNVWLARMNATLTEADWVWIAEFMTAYRADRG